MKGTLPQRVRLGVFEVDLRAGELRQDNGAVLVLSDQPLQILRMLIEADGEIVTREDIQKKLWPNDTVVEFDHSINNAIKKLRRALVDSGDEPHYIGTIAKRGYRLLVAVERVAAAEESPGEVGPQAAGDVDSAMPVQLDPRALSGRTVSHYRVLDIIGGGGMGVVYRAEDLKLGRRVALKFLPEEMGTDPHALERFDREARAVSSLDHPNICTIHEFGEHEGRPFMAMQLLQGQTLRDRLEASEGPLPLEELLDIGILVSDGLQAAHERGIVHRDIKPANIFITDKGVCKILDFGVAKLLEEAPRFSPANLDEEMVGAPAFRPANRDKEEMGLQPRSELHLTRTGSAMGTAGYMSPEQVRGEKLDVRTDLFSFGLVLYEMATGQRAFTGDTAGMIRDAIVSDSPVPVRELNPKLPARLVSTIAKALEKDRTQRYQSATEIRTELEQVRGKSASQTGGGRSVRNRVLAAVAALLVTTMAATLFWRSHRVVRLTAKDSIVVADFDNSTGDPLFDGTLMQALTSGLEQSPFLNVLPERKVADILKLMNRPANYRLAGATAREVCLRGNSKALLEGRIARDGQGFKIAVKAIDCQTGNTLAEAGTEAAGRSDVLPKLGSVSQQLRQSLGESLASVQTFSRPLEEATTSSLEALQEYSWGRRLHLEKDGRESVPHYLRALELDPNFAQAHASLAGAYAMSGGSDDLVEQHLQKAYELRDRVSLRERFQIETSYLEVVRCENSKAIVAYKNWIRAFPQDPIPRSNLAFIYGARGQWQDALAQGQFAIQLLPEAIIPRWNVEQAYLRLGDLSGAKRTFEETRAQNMDGVYLRYYRYIVAFDEGDSRTMQDQLSWAAGRPGAEGTMLNTQSETEAYYGRFDRSRQYAEKAVACARRDGVPVSEVHWTVNMAWMAEEVGLQSEARRLLLTVPTISSGDEPNAAFVLARLGQTSQAQKLVDKIDRKYPFHEINHSFALALARAAIAVENKDPNRAIAVLEVSKPYEMGAGALIPAYLRGLAFLQAGNPLKASAEFQNIMAHPTLVDNRIIGALAHLQLGRAQVMMRDKNAAGKSYQDFLTLWKDADPDIPIYQQAKAEYAKLQ